MSPTTSTLTSAPSDPFHIVPVDISSVSFVSSAGTATRDTVLSSAATNVAILRVVADSWTNTDTGGGNLDLAIDTIEFDQSLSTGLTPPTYTIRKITDNEDGTFACTATATKVTCPVSTSDDDFVLED